VPTGPEFAGIPVETGAARDVNALQLLLQSPVYQRLVTHLVHTGGVRLAYDKDAAREARWDPKARTIWLKPGGSMAERAGRIAFELANALMNPSFEALLNAVRTGQVTDPEVYATLCEKIEYESAKIRHAGSKQQMATPWPKEVAPTGRHFETDASFREDWDGKWTTFEGYLDTQKQTRHWHGYVGRFDQLPQRREYLAELERQLQETLATAQMDVEEKVT